MQKKLPESQNVLVYILLSDMMNTIVREIISLSSENGGNRSSGAIACIVSFVLILVLFFGSLVAIDIGHDACHTTAADVRLRAAFMIIQSVGAILYYFGNNLVYISKIYGSELGCSESCFNMSRVAAMIFLGGALAYFQLIPPCLQKIARLFNYEKKHHEGFSAANMIAIFVKIDALFNTVSLASRKFRYSCSSFTIALTTAFIIFCIVLGNMITLVNFIYTLRILRKSNKKQLVSQFMTNFILFLLLFISFPPYLLTDNTLPLECAFRCSAPYYLNNTSLISSSCNIKISGLRLSFSAILFVTIITVSLLLLVYKRRIRKEQIDSSSYVLFKSV